MPLPRLLAAGATDPGRQREHNEDTFVCDPERGVFMVIDGVGGYAAGEVAAEIARDLVSMRLRYRAGGLEERMRKAITTANKAIFHQSHTDPAQRGMACVLTAVVIDEETVTVGHVGDTRLYELTRSGIQKLTRDHSLVGVREDRGELSEWEAMLHPRRNEILRDVGSEWHELGDDDFIDLQRFTFAPEAALLLCTDGLSDLVPRETIHETVLAHAGHPDAAVRALIEQANRAGGVDNITAVLIEGAHFAPLITTGRTPGLTIDITTDLATAAVPTEGLPDAPAAPRRLARRRDLSGFALGVLALVLALALATMLVYLGLGMG